MLVDVKIRHALVEILKDWQLQSAGSDDKFCVVLYRQQLKQWIVLLKDIQLNDRTALVLVVRFDIGFTLLSEHF